MFIHIGNNAVVRREDIIGVFDMDNTTVSRFSREFLANAQKTGRICDICDDLPKSYIVTNYRGTSKVYISSVSSQTILKRTASENMSLK